MPLGSLPNKFRCLLGTLEQKPDNVKDIAEAAVVLHNLLRIRQTGIAAHDADIDDENYNVIPSAWRDQLDWTDVDQPSVVFCFVFCDFFFFCCCCCCCFLLFFFF